MVSKRILGLVDGICRFVKKSSSPLGGIQGIFVGDFLQLPPVPNGAYGDAGDYSFTHPSFRDMVPHTITLTQVGGFFL